MKQNNTEYWLTGAVPHIIPMLQPVVHTLLQAQREITELMYDCSNEILWQMPAGVASPAFHLQHIAGVLNRLFTYADDKQLTEEQLTYLAREGKEDAAVTVQSLLATVSEQIDWAVTFLKTIQTETLTEVRYVGRKKLPSTQLGLLFHAAEHTMRHTGQLLVTVKILSDKNKKED